MRGFPALLIGIVMVGAVIGLRAPSPSVSASPSAATPGASTAVAATPVAPAPVPHRPGEPMLVPGQGDGVTLRRAANGHFIADATINGQPVPMLVDTGATTVALTVEDARRLGLPIDPSQFQVVGLGASGPTRGQLVMLDDVAVGDRPAGSIEAVVLEGLGESLLGQTYLSRVEMRVTGDTMVLR